MAKQTTHRPRVRRGSGQDPSWEEWISPNGSAGAPPAGDGRTASVSDLAYSLWQARGCPHGSPDEDWFRAEAMLREQASQ